MKIGILSDAHGNAIGLKNCLDFLRTQKLDKLVYLGDMVGYMPEANKVIELVRQDCEIILSGNHEAMLLGELDYNPERDSYYKLAEAKKSISKENLDFLKTLECKKERTICDKKVLFIHASPQDPLKGYIYPDTEIEPADVNDYDAVFMGHTHHPFIKQIENTLVVNVGSCGLPRDVGSLSACAIYNSDTNTAEVFRIPLTFAEILEKYGSHIHEDVLAVFKRTTDNLIGTIV